MKKTVFSFPYPLFVRVLEKIMFAFLIAFPFGMASFLQLKMLFPSADSLFSQWRVLFYPFFLFAFILALGGSCCHSKKLCLIFLGLLALSGAILRIYVGYTLSPVPVSDFGLCYSYASSGAYAENLARAPYNAVYSLLLRLLVSLFGTGVFPIVVFQSIFLMSVPILVYFACVHAFAKPFVGLSAAGFYALNPAMILYSAVTSPENISPVFFTATFFFFILAWKERALRPKRSLLFSVFAALSLGLTNAFKPVGSLILVAFFVAEFLMYLLPFSISFFRSRETRKVAARTICLSLSAIAICVVSKDIVFFGAQKFCEQQLGYPVYYKVDYSLSSIGSVAYFGLSPVGGGQWNSETADTLWAAMDRFSDPKDASQFLMRKLIDELKDFGLPSFIELLKNKIAVSWGSEWMIGYYATRTDTTGTEPSVFETPKGNFWCYVIPTMYTTLINIGASLCFFFFLFRKKQSDPFEIFMACILGIVFCAFLILEAQNRYKSTFVPLICIVSAVGYVNCAAILTRGFFRMSSALHRYFSR